MGKAADDAQKKFTDLIFSEKDFRLSISMLICKWFG
jgi:hypothetical protein